MAVAPGTLRSAKELIQRGQAAQAEAMLRRALQKDPADGPASNLLGIALSRLGQDQQAEYFMRSAVKASPNEPSYHNSLGNLLTKVGRSHDAADAFARAVAIDGRYFPGWIGLSAALCGADRFVEAAEAAARAVEVDPSRFEGHDNLAIALFEGGRVDEAIAVLRPAIASIPDSTQLVRGLVTGLLTRQDEPSDEAVDLSRRLGAQIGAPAPARERRPVQRSGRMRVGFLSPDLRTHSVAYFLEPIVGQLDRTQFTVACYDTENRADATTARLKGAADEWRVVAGMDSAAIAEQARRDKVDIMIDLAGHTLRSRVGALAFGAAPVQATYIGYAATTGVPGVDYRIVDSTTDPEGSDRWCTERLARLEPCFLCYRAPENAPDVAPRAPGAPVVFGSFNMIQKIAPAVVRAWAGLLAGAPGSSLLIKNRALADPRTAQRVLAEFEALGVDPSRLTLLGQMPSPADHMALYGRIDIALDTFPYNGTTTTCEALWMGVPVVALAGKAHAGRVGLSLLRAAGLADLAAPDIDGYARVALDLAADGGRRAALRASLRERMRSSVLMDAPAFAARFGAMLRRMWDERCRAE